MGNTCDQVLLRLIPETITRRLTRWGNRYCIMRCTHCRCNHISWEAHTGHRRCPYCPSSEPWGGGDIGVLCLTQSGRRMAPGDIRHAGYMWLRENVQLSAQYPGYL